jgi:hypothetical protein
MQPTSANRPRSKIRPCALSKVPVIGPGAPQSPTSFGVCDDCVVILSPHYLENTGWARAEFDAIVTRHMDSDGDFLIRLWHNVSKEQVAAFSPLVAGILAINTNIGEVGVFEQVRRALLAE